MKKSIQFLVFLSPILTSGTITTKLIMLVLTMEIFLYPHQGLANNIAVSNISLTNQNIAGDYVWIKFDLSWENSWRTNSGPANWDAAWTFAKFRVNSGPWKHAQLHYVDGTNDGHAGPSSVTISTSSDRVGCFIYRSVNGTGNVNWQGIHLRWDYGLNGVGDNDLIDLQVFAYEMVYVPQGSFPLGGGTGDENGKFYRSPTTSDSYVISSEAAINIGPNAGDLYYNIGGNSGDQSGPLPASYPKGYNAFYCMKYEVTQGQWVDFFNSLDGPQKANNDITGLTGKNSDSEVVRNTVSWSGGTAAATSVTPDLPLNYINSSGRNAFLDWCGLRYMSELEYEKACQGPVNVQANAYAWGNANITSGSYSIVNPGTAFETVSNPAQLTGNASYSPTNGTPSGPLRVGIFAASAINKNREETGASYYGIMELSGNVYEVCISGGNPRGRSYDGQHGNGNLTSSGNGDVPNWPNPAVSPVGNAYRGGSYINSGIYLRVKDRFDAANIYDISNGRIGLRGVRKA